VWRGVKTTWVREELEYNYNIATRTTIIDGLTIISLESTH
jgi:hypothetical protein